MFFKTMILFIAMTNFAMAQYPSGTLVFSSKKSLVGRIAERLTGGDQYTHVSIVIDGLVYESDWPRAKKVRVSQYGKHRATYDYFIPKNPYSQDEINRMRSKAESELGKPYQLRNYFNPNSRKTKGTWCSPYVGNVLNASGRYRFTKQTMHEPQGIFNRIKSQHQFSSRIKR